MPPKGSALEALAAEWDVTPTLPDWLTDSRGQSPPAPLVQLYNLCMGLALTTGTAFRQYAANPCVAIFTATVANNYRRLYDDVGTKLMVRCLKFTLT